MISVAAALLLPLAISFLFLSAIWPGRSESAADLLLKGSLAVGLGLGASSAGYFVWLVLFGPSGALFVAEAAVLAALVALTLIRARRRGRADGASFRERPATRFSKLERLLSAGFIAVLVSSVAYFLALTGTYPYGRWDALTIWNLRARFLYRGGEYWRDAFSDALGGFAQTDYPLLVSGAIARAWQFVGSDTTVVPVAVAMLFTFAIAGLLVAAVSMFRSRGQGLLAGVALLGTEALVWQGSTQYADVPLAFFILAALVCITLAGRARGGGPRFLFLAGLLAGLAAWTKNEGLLFVSALAVAYVLAVVLTGGRRDAARRCGVLLLGLAPMLVLVAGFKMGFASSNGLVAAFEPSTAAAYIRDPVRWGLVLGSFADRFIRIGDWLISLPVALAIYLVAVGVRVDGEHRVGIVTAALAVAAVLGGYFIVLLSTPHNLAWHLETALHRLIMHVWPSILFVYFMIVRTPEEAASRAGLSSAATGPPAA